MFRGNIIKLCVNIEKTQETLLNCEFYNSISCSTNLKIFKIRIKLGPNDRNNNELLEALSLNKSIIDLDLSENNLDKDNIIQVIMQNKYILQLNLSRISPLIDEKLMEALLLNTTITLLDISEDQIEAKIIILLLKCNLQYINLSNAQWNSKDDCLIG